MSSDPKSFLEWRQAWLLDHEAIDSQHLQMASLLNDLAVSHVENPGSDSMKILLSLRDETRRHFSEEEQMMRELDYPGFPDHYREHVVLLAELQDFIREVETGRKPLNNEALTDLKRWFINHVLTNDKDFVKYLKRNMDEPRG